MTVRRRELLRAGGAGALVGLTGCLGSLTGGGSAQFRPAVEALNRGVDAVNRAQTTRNNADDAYSGGRHGEAARLYATARDRFDAAAAEFDTARAATSGKCVAVHDRAVRQYRRTLASVEACDVWAEAATTRAAGGTDADVANFEERARVWDGRVADYDAPSKMSPENIRC